MNTNRITRSLPWLVLGCGAISGILWALMMHFCTDDRGLLKVWNLPHILLLLITVGVLTVVVLLTRNLGGSNRYRSNFRPSLPAGITSFALSGGLLLLMLRSWGSQRDLLSALWLITGFLSVPALIFMGLQRIRGKRPQFLLYTLVSIFFSVHLANQYRNWSGQPRMADYILQLFASIFLLLNSYNHAAFAAGMGRRLRHLLYGLLASYFSLACALVPQFGLFYLLCGIWSAANLCRLMPPSRRSRPKEEPPAPAADLP